MNILLTTVGRRSYLVEYFKEALAGSGLVHAANSSDLTPAFLCADKSVVTPLIYDSEYIPFLLDYCKENNIGAILSLFDVDLPILAHHRKEFEEIGTKVIVSNEPFVQICNDKWKTFQFCMENGFQGPKTYLSLEEAKAALEKGDLTYPVMVKPRWGMGSIAVYEAENNLELEVFYEKVKTGIKNSYLKYEATEFMEEAVLIQEKLPGQEYGLDIIQNLEAEYKNTIVKKKIAMRSGETDCAITMDDPELKKLGKKIAKISKHIGNLDVDVFLVGNQPYILEMNPRFGGGYPFSHIAGIHLPKALVHWLKGESLGDQFVYGEKVGVLAHKDIQMKILNDN